MLHQFVHSINQDNENCYQDVNIQGTIVDLLICDVVQISIAITIMTTISVTNTTFAIKIAMTFVRITTTTMTVKTRITITIIVRQKILIIIVPRMKQMIVATLTLVLLRQHLVVLVSINKKKSLKTMLPIKKIPSGNQLLVITCPTMSMITTMTMIIMPVTMSAAMTLALQMKISRRMLREQRMGATHHLPTNPKIMIISAITIGRNSKKVAVMILKMKKIQMTTHLKISTMNASMLL